MSKISDKTKEITTGWKGYLLDSDIEEDIVNKRAIICSGCPFAKKMFFSIFTDNKMKSIEHYKCSKCGCPLSPKIRSVGNCPEEKW